jgi:thymidylate kinase
MRDADQLDRTDPKMEIDLLVAPGHLHLLEGLVRELGFISLADWGYYPHQFFLYFDEDNDSWLKLDVVTKVSFGNSISSLHTSFAVKCLAGRQSSAGIFTPCPADELIALLLHCLLDKGFFTRARQKRLGFLLEKVCNDPELTLKVISYFQKPEFWSRIAASLRTGNWDELLANREEISSNIIHSNKFLSAALGIWLFSLRKLNRIRRFISPLAPSIVLLAPDGAGKTTLSDRLKENSYFPVNSIYMGLYQKKERFNNKRSVPGLKPVIRLIKIWQNYLKARYYQACGHMVIFDRYIYDALLPSQRPLSPGERLNRWLISHSCPHPNLTILLDAPGEVLFARKGEHSPSFLENQRQAYSSIKKKLPNLVTIDATQSIEVNQHNIISLAWRLIQGTQAGFNFNHIVREWVDKSNSYTDPYPISVENSIEISR